MRQITESDMRLFHEAMQSQLPPDNFFQLEKFPVEILGPKWHDILASWTFLPSVTQSLFSAYLTGFQMGRLFEERHLDLIALESEYNRG